MVGQQIHASLERMEMRAEPHGLFYATLYLIEAGSGEHRTVTATGRLTGGCSMVVGGAVSGIADPRSVPACADVIGGL